MTDTTIDPNDNARLKRLTKALRAWTIIVDMLAERLKPLQPSEPGAPFIIKRDTPLCVRRDIRSLKAGYEQIQNLSILIMELDAKRRNTPCHFPTPSTSETQTSQE